MNNMALAHYTALPIILEINSSKFDKDCVYIGIRPTFEMYMFYADHDTGMMFLVNIWLGCNRVITKDHQQVKVSTEIERFCEIREEMQNRIVKWANGDADKVDWSK